MTKLIGRPVPRLEDARLLSGGGRYTDDLAPPDALFAVFVRAPHAHALIRAIDVTAAQAAPGVLAVLTAADYAADGNRPIRHQANPPDALVPTRPWFTAGPGVVLREAPQPPLVADHVRHAGEAVAMVVATSRAEARDAAELVDVEYIPLRAVVSAVAALKPEAPLLFADVPGNLALDVQLGDVSATAAAFATAACVVRQDFANQRLANCQMEPRAAHALWDEAAGRVTLVAGSQGVVRQRLTLAESLDLPPAKVRVISPDVGGGFGPRTPLYPEAVLVAWAARRLGRTVRWTGERGEAFLTDYQARDLHTEAELALAEDGTILALRCRLVGNLGAHPVAFVPLANGSRLVSTVYHVPQATVRVLGVLTNSVPTAPYRGAGRPEATLVIERLLDLAALRLGLDRVTIRRRNLVRRDQLPYRNVMGLTYDSGDFHANLDATLKLADWEGFAARRAASAEAGLLRGIGVANYIESPVGAPRERVVVRVRPEDGGVIDLIAGTQSTGQGHATVFAQVLGELLGVEAKKVQLRTGDTDFVQVGGGSHSDRSMRLVGTLLDRASISLLARAREAAALLLGRPADGLAFADGCFTAPDGGARRDLFQIATALRDGLLPAQMGDKLEVTEEIEDRIAAYPTGCAVCELEVDPATGLVSVARYCSVDDVGQPINPLIVDGQVHGGIVQGIGQALFEAVVLDEHGQMLSGSFMDYALTRADRVPSFRVALAEHPTTGNPLRIKGGGEGGITPATAVVMNALADALAGHGIHHVEMPATPERVWRLLQAARAS